MEEKKIGEGKCLEKVIDMCTHPFQFLSVAKDEVDRRKGTLWEKGDNACTKKVWWQEQVLQALDE